MSIGWAWPHKQPWGNLHSRKHHSAVTPLQWDTRGDSQAWLTLMVVVAARKAELELCSWTVIVRDRQITYIDRFDILGCTTASNRQQCSAS